jgi:hypothetical protein
MNIVIAAEARKYFLRQIYKRSQERKYWHDQFMTEENAVAILFAFVKVQRLDHEIKLLKEAKHAFDCSIKNRLCSN